jgi:hypothetical protein
MTEAFRESKSSKFFMKIILRLSYLDVLVERCWGTAKSSLAAWNFLYALYGGVRKHRGLWTLWNLRYLGVPLVEWLNTK